MIRVTKKKMQLERESDVGGGVCLLDKLEKLAYNGKGATGLRWAESGEGRAF